MILFVINQSETVYRLVIGTMTVW